MGRGREEFGWDEGGRSLGIVGIDRREREAKLLRGECRLGAPAVVVLVRKCCFRKMIMEYFLMIIYQINLSRLSIA